MTDVDVRPAPGGNSTLTDIRRTGENARSHLARMAAIGVLAVIVVLGATGLFGVRSATTSAAGAGYTMSLTYPRTARAGLDVPWTLIVRHPGGFDKPFTIALSASYFDILEYQDFHPEPSSETGDGTWNYLQFDPPPDHSSTFRLSLDTYVQPASQIGRTATVRLIAHGVQVAQVRFSTFLMP